MNKIISIMCCLLLVFPNVMTGQNNQKDENSMETLNLTKEWDKTFSKSDKVNHSKVTFKNR